MRGFRRQADEIPKSVMRRRGLRIAAIRLHFHRMDQIGEFDRVLDEEHRDVVADEVPVAFLGIELHGEAAHVARRVGRTGAAGDGRKAHEDLRLFAGLAEKIGARICRSSDSVSSK